MPAAHPGIPQSSVNRKHCLGSVSQQASQAASKPASQQASKLASQPTHMLYDVLLMVP